MSLRCRFGQHTTVRDRANNGGPQVLRCTRCWKIFEYPETDPGKVEALRAEQQRQAAQIAVKRQWVPVARGPALLPWPGRRRAER